MLIDAIKTLKEYIKYFSRKRGYKRDVENAKNLLNQYEKRLQTENKIKEMYNNLN